MVEESDEEQDSLKVRQDQYYQAQWHSGCSAGQYLSQDLETGCLKLAVVKFWCVQIFKEDHNILIFQP